MRLVLALLLVTLSTALAVGAMLLVRRRAPEGSAFNDGDRASGVFGVLATGFSVLLGFVVFLAFTSYDTSRNAATEEALLVGQQFETAQFFPAAAGRRLSGELVCYARSIVHQEWPELEDGVVVDNVNPWGLALFETLKTVAPRTPAEEANYGKWLDENSDREAARSTRLHAAEGVIPSPLWIVLLFISAAILIYMLFFADSAEGPVVQGMLIGSVVAVMVATLALIRFLDDPFRPGPGSLQPTAMERTLATMEEAARAAGVSIAAPCTRAGGPA